MASCKVQLNRRSSQYGADERPKNGIPSTSGVNLKKQIPTVRLRSFLTFNQSEKMTV